MNLYKGVTCIAFICSNNPPILFKYDPPYTPTKVGIHSLSSYIINLYL